MAKRKTSRAVSILYATIALALCVLPPFLLGNCRLDTRPLSGPRAKWFESDEDAGD